MDASNFASVYPMNYKKLKTLTHCQQAGACAGGLTGAVVGGFTGIMPGPGLKLKLLSLNKLQVHKDPSYLIGSIENYVIKL